MATLSTNPAGRHAVVIGGSLAGLLAARVLADHFSHVTLIERDPMHDEPESRKGQPQTRHLHGLLAQGLQVMTHYFPDLPQALEDGGAMVDDMATTMRWYTYGGYRTRFQSGLRGATMSRPFLEWQIRRRVVALPNVAVLDGWSVERLLTTPDRAHVTGVVARYAADGHTEQIAADLVVDAGGRGSSTPRWLERLRYARPPESVVRVSVAYTTRIYRRDVHKPGSRDWMFVTPVAPHERRMGGAFPIEGERWLVGLAGWHGDHPPADEQGFVEFARSLPAPDIYEIVSQCEPLTPLVTHKFLSSVRRHYERLERFPEGYLVIGDAVCSFNPTYGQGMTSAALQAQALDHLLTERHGDLHGIARPFFKHVAKVIDIPWQLAVGEDFRFPETKGKRAPGTALINAYVARVHHATHHDPLVCAAFLYVMNLIKPPTSLFHPRILWRVLRPRRRERETYQQVTLKRSPAQNAEEMI